MAAAAPVIGGVMGAGGALMEGDERSKALTAEAEAADKNAKLAREDAAYNAERQSMNAGQRIAQMRTGFAASGITSDSVSALEVLRMSSINAEMDRLNIVHGGEMRARNLEDRATAARIGARKAKKIGQINAFTALFGAGAKAASYGDSGGSSSMGSTDSGGSYSGSDSSGGSYLDAGAIA